jgi:rfaE bifunctional protein nucleotidyltransferase chain/domain
LGHYLSEAELLKQIAAQKAAGQKIVFTNGCFDLLHVGHVRYLQAARALGDELVVAINSDASVKRLKGPERPIQTENDRAEIMAALGCVSYSVLFTEDTPARIIEAIKPHILVKGGDWKISQIVGGEFVQSYGGQVLSLQFIDGKSTTKLIEKARV